ncbi:unnamed protein product [Agarophyton chilense]
MDSAPAEDAFMSWDDLPALAPLDPLMSTATPGRDHEWPISLYDPSSLQDVPHVSLDGELALPLESSMKREPQLPLPTSPIQSSQTIRQHPLANAVPQATLKVTPPSQQPPQQPSQQPPQRPSPQPSQQQQQPQQQQPPRPLPQPPTEPPQKPPQSEKCVDLSGRPVGGGAQTIFRAMHAMDARTTSSHSRGSKSVSPMLRTVPHPNFPPTAPGGEANSPRSHSGTTVGLGVVRTIEKTEDCLKQTGTKKRTVSTKASSLSLKAKREREAAMFPKEALADLGGTTSAQVRKMTEDQRKLVLYKRKLRNRISAKKSRANRQTALAQLRTEVDEIQTTTVDILETTLAVARENERLRRCTADQDRRISMLEEENEMLRRRNGKEERHTSLPIERKLGA